MKTIPHHIRPMLTIVLLALWCLYTPSASAQHLLGSHSNAKELEALQKLKLFVNDIERFHHSFPLERAYLHFDNTAYFRGEDIWLKAYVMRTDSNQLTNLSRVLYVELVAPSGDVLQTHKLHLQNGQAEGCIPLDSLFTSGFYEVRAYTRYMVNEGSDAVFSRVFPIFDLPQKVGQFAQAKIETRRHNKRLPNNRTATTSGPTTKEESNGTAEQPTTVTRQGMSVTFFPEGGHSISGVKGRMTIVVTDNSGVPLQASGYLVCRNDTMAAVQTEHEGMGRFTYLPQLGLPASLHLTDSTGRHAIISMPEPEPIGVALKVDMSDSLKARITVSTSIELQSTPLALVQTYRGAVYSVVPFVCDGKPLVLNCGREEMEEGVNRFSVIDADGNILADRLVFVHPTSAPQPITVERIEGNAQPYGRIKLHLKAPAGTTFSVAVHDAATDIQPLQGDLRSWMLLSSDLKGYIHQPQYYLESSDAKHRLHTDLLMGRY